jgi:hypothetical protein
LTRLKTLQQKNLILKNQIKNKYKEVRLHVNGECVVPVVEEKVMTRASIKSTITTSTEASVSRLKTLSARTSKGSIKSKTDLFVTDFGKDYETLSYDSQARNSMRLPTAPLSNFKGRPVNMSLNKTDVTLLDDLKVSKLRMKIPMKYK